MATGTCWAINWPMVVALLALTSPRVARELVEARTMWKSGVGTAKDKESSQRGN